MRNGPWPDPVLGAVGTMHPVDARLLGVPAVTAHVVNDARRHKVKFLTYARSPCWQVAEPGFEPWSLDTSKPPSEAPRFLVSSLETEEGWPGGGSDGGHFSPCLGLMMTLTHGRWLERSQ